MTAIAEMMKQERYLEPEVVFHVDGDVGPKPMDLGSDEANVLEEQEELLLRVCVLYMSE